MMILCIDSLSGFGHHSCSMLICDLIIALSLLSSVTSPSPININGCDSDVIYHTFNAPQSSSHSWHSHTSSLLKHCTRFRHQLLSSDKDIVSHFSCLIIIIMSVNSYPFKLYILNIMQFIGNDTKFHERIGWEDARAEGKARISGWLGSTLLSLIDQLGGHRRTSQWHQLLINFCVITDNVYRLRTLW